MSEKYLGENSTPILINQIKEKCTLKVSTLPTASADELGKIYQYIGTTSGSIVHNYFYECTYDGTTLEYSWTQTNVQPHVNPTASNISYDNTTSGLTADDVQEAVDEVEGRIDTAESDIDNIESLIPQDTSTTNMLVNNDALGTAAFKDFTPNVAPNNHNLVESNAVYNAITTALTSVYTPRGDLTCAELTSSLLIAANVGNIYEMSDTGTTSNLFLQGAGQTIHVGDNVGIIQTGVDTYKFNLMANAFDMTDYQKKNLTSAVEGQTTVEDALSALSTNKADKVTSATNGDIATLDANGNLVDSGISKNGFVRTGVISTSSGDGYKKVEITTSQAYLNGRFYLKDRRGNEYVIMIASGYPTAFYRLARVNAIREYIVEVRQTRGHNGKLNVFIHSLEFDEIGYTFIGCDNVNITVSDSDATEFATGTAITWQKFVTNSDLNDYMWQNRTRTNDVLADALNISTPTILEGSGTAYTGNVPYSALKYAIFLVIPRGGDRFVMGWINGAIVVNNYNSTTWNGWSLHEAPTSSVTSGGTAPVTSGGVYDAIQNPAKWKGLVITAEADTKATFFQKIVNTFGTCNSGDWITIADNANKFGYAAGIMICRSDRLQGMLVPHWTTSGARIYFINCRRETAQDATLRYVDLSSTTEVTF